MAQTIRSFIKDWPIETQEPIAEKKYTFHKVLWKGVIEILKCDTCGYCDESRDQMILHVISHAPKEAHDKLLDELMRSK